MPLGEREIERYIYMYIYMDNHIHIFVSILMHSFVYFLNYKVH